ncbi:MAG: InlB B-repeat-containing protein [Clostridia bacterium]|nr:InlB B-repeat-containing protein [Clostridia bacterium]
MKKQLIKIFTTVMFILTVVVVCAVFSHAQISPECTGMTVSGYEAELTFDHCGEGLRLSSGNRLAGIEVWSLGRWVTPDEAYISAADAVTVKYSDAFSMVRYEGGNLVSSEGTLASGFTRQAARNASSGYIDAAVVSSGCDIYTPVNSTNFRYQYGASAIVNPDGSIDVWASSHGTSAVGLRVLDYISYFRSEDGGATWSDRKIVLSPTAVSMDHHSVCDPGVIRFGGYYYLGYTSTLDHGGFANNVFVARSRTPDGPFEKWNGSGWGGDPAPLIQFEDYSNHWGAGEVSFVELDGRLYIYYSLREWTNTEGYVNKTMVATADASDGNWPATVQKYGVCAVRSGSPSGADVKYHEATGKFIMMGMENAMTDRSALYVFQSDDGLSFTQCDTLNTNVYYYGNNNGLSGSPNGHIVEGDQTFITYAYGTQSTNWATRLAPVTYTLASSPDTSDKASNMIKANHGFKQESYTMGITAEKRFYVKHVSDGAFTIPVLKFSNVMGRSAVTDTQNILFSGYDSSVVTFVNNVCTPVGAGETEATVRYGDFFNTVKIIVRPEDVSTEYDTLISFTPEEDVITVELGTPAQPQIKGVGVSYAGKIAELYNDPNANSYDFNSGTHVVTYTGYDPAIISVSSEGIIVPYAKGNTVVNVTCESTDEDHQVSNSLSFTVTVKVVAPRQYTLTMDAAGGFSGAPEKLTAAAAQPYSELFPFGIPVPAKAGYRFVSWVNRQNSAILKLNANYSYRADTVFRAVWTPSETYTVSFDANGGTGAPADQAKKLGVNLALPSAAPVRDGYTFLGWGLTPNTTAVRFAAGAKYTYNADARLYAVWQSDKSLEWETDNYDLVIHDASDIEVIRLAPGVFDTLDEIRAAEGLRTFNTALILAGTDANGDLRIDLLSTGSFSMWVRLNDKRTFIVSDIKVEPERITPYVSSIEGITVRIEGLGSDIKDIFLAPGRLSTYRECSDSKIVRLTQSTFATPGRTSNYGRTINYVIDYRSVSASGDYTMCVRFNSGRETRFSYFHIDCPEPTVSVNGLQITVDGLRNIRNIRIAPGEYETAGDVKRAPGVRLFNKNDTLKHVDQTNYSYTIQCRDDGPYTLSIEYIGGYAVVATVDAERLVPTVTENGDGTLTFGDLDGLYIIRYAPGIVTAQGDFKKTPGNGFYKAADAAPDGTITTGVFSGKWSFMVQYNELSCTVFSYDFDLGSYVG